MKRTAVILALSLVACNKAPSAPTPPEVPAAPAAATVVTYQCHSTQKSRDLFMRFDADGPWEIGVDANSLKPSGDMILFPQSGVATWTDPLPNGKGFTTNTFDKNKGEYTWSMDPDGSHNFIDQALYHCKPV